VGSNSRNLQQVDYQGSEKELQKKNLSEDKLDKEIMELRGLMKSSSKETREECSDKVGESLQFKVWKPGEESATTGEQQHQEQGKETRRQFQIKVWDPGGLQL
jgi:hypothetical protein